MDSVEGKNRMEVGDMDAYEESIGDRPKRPVLRFTKPEQCPSIAYADEASDDELDRRQQRELDDDNR